METSILEIGKDGLKATVYVGIDLETAVMLALAIFLGIVLALIVYAKIK